MDGEQLLKMDTYMLLSIINMKLRDEFSSLDYLCEDYNIDQKELSFKLSGIGYIYNKQINQFTAVG